VKNMRKRVSLSENIRLLREAQGYSQEYIALRLEITQQAYSTIEKAPEKATLKRLKDIALILQVPLVTLLGEDEIIIQQNFNQAGGNAATIFKNIQQSPESNIRLISELKEEILFLRSLIKRTEK
jgi:transcriptional regulator with XRE-family HTH domain